MKQITWLGLGYNVPVNPSKNRVYVWRKLKECGAGAFRPGVAILPKSPQSMDILGKLAAKITQMGGDAVIVELRFCDTRKESEMIEKFRAQSEREYMELIRDCGRILSGTGELRSVDNTNADELRRALKRYGKVKSRDFFRSRSQSHVANGLVELADDMALVAGDIGSQLRSILEI